LKRRIKFITFCFELTDELYEWYKDQDDRSLANGMLEITFDRMFDLCGTYGLHDPIASYNKLHKLVQNAYGWLLIDLVFEPNAPFEIKRVNVCLKNRSLLLKVRCRE